MLSAISIAKRMPHDFILGVATSSWQIEGSSHSRGRSIWDDFAEITGYVKDGANVDPACDHLNKWREDLNLIKELGFNAYRLSISWPRILPDGTGNINVAGLNFYDKLIDRLLELKIKPVLTIYHWDLPSKLQDLGGWESPQTVDAFTEYTEVLANKFADRVDRWATLNEPWCPAFLGYSTKIHAPALGKPGAGFTAAYYQMLAHARAVAVLRSKKAQNIGTVLNLFPVLTNSTEVEEAVMHIDGVQNRLFLDPLAGRGIPQDVIERTLDLNDWKFINDSEVKEMSAKIDWLGVNYYTVMRIDSINKQFEGETLGQDAGAFPGTPAIKFTPQEPRTQMGWEVNSEGLTETLKITSERLPGVPLFVTENGSAYPDSLINGEIKDIKRTEYFANHISATLDAIDQGVDVRGYFAWSLLDNLEWAEGWSKRFGIVHVDPVTQVRTQKNSAKFLQEISKSR